MDEWQCAEYTAEQALGRVAGSAVPIKAAKVTTWSFDDNNDEHICSFQDFVGPNEDNSVVTAAIQQVFVPFQINGHSNKADVDWLQGYASLGVYEHITDGFSDQPVKDILRRRTTIEGIRLHTATLIKHFDLSQPMHDGPHTMPLSKDPTVSHRSNPGGRPAGKHGDAIAAATLRLAGLQPGELTTYTAAAIANELVADYRKLGETPPNERSLETYALGILRVLRARHT